MWGVPVVQPARSRLAAMVRTLEVELPSRRAGTELVVGGRRLLLHGDRVCLDGGQVALSQAPLAVLRALADRPGHVVSRRELMGHLPSGLAASEHAVEVAVARLRSAVGPRLVQTVVKRGYRLAV
jgi:uroporphyrinogen-III synthase